MARRRRLVDPEDLLDSKQAATLMGISGADAFAVYARRYDDFPAPLIVRSHNCRLYLRQDIEAFLKRHPGIGSRKRSGDEKADPS